ncbi:MAG: hypothetical protein AB1730_21370 [Myxococcota bacterium]
MRLVHLAVLLAACALVARTANTVVEASLWPPPSAGVAVVESRERPADPPLDGARLATLLALEPRVTPEAPTVVDALPFTLLGTLAPTFACVAEQPSDAVHTVAVGDSIAGAELVAVERGAIVVRRDGRLERLVSASSPTASPGAPRSSASVLKSDVAAAIRDFPSHAPKLHVVPTFVNGQDEGFRLFGASRIPLLAQAGLKDGDVIRRVNGVVTARPDQLLELLPRLATLTRVDLELVRDGATVHHAISLE